MLPVTVGGRKIGDFVCDNIANVGPAYSLRKLRSSYAGSAIRVRRSSDNTEQDIGFVDGVLDTASLASFVDGNNGFITKWYDQSLTNDLVQTTTANQPSIVAAGVIYTLDNGTPTIYSSGGTIFLSCSASITRASGSAVATYGTGSDSLFTGNPAIWGGNTSSPVGVLQGQSGGSGFFPTNGTTNHYIGGRFSRTGFLPTSTAGKIVSADTSSANNTIPSPVTNNLRVFGAFSWESWVGEISEIILTSTRMGIQQRALLTTNQSAFYGIAI